MSPATNRARRIESVPHCGVRGDFRGWATTNDLVPRKWASRRSALCSWRGAMEKPAIGDYPEYMPCCAPSHLNGTMLAHTERVLRARGRRRDPRVRCRQLPFDAPGIRWCLVAKVSNLICGGMEGQGFTDCGRTRLACHSEESRSDRDDEGSRTALKTLRARFLSRKAGSE